jgi:NlpC/P60 family
MTPAVLVSIAGPTSITGPPSPGAEDGGVLGIPPSALAVYGAAATACPRLSWSVLAAIGTIESGNGTSRLAGVDSGHNPAGAEGPMQFEPPTFALYDRPVPSGGANPPNPYDLVDAAYAAARMLCADGGSDPSTLGSALYQYNHSGTYVAAVLHLAESYGLGSEDPSRPGSMLAVDFALSQIGVPYRWGGEVPGRAFDCSGLAQAAWATAGIQLPRVAQDQMRVGPAVPAGDPVLQGDLVFFGPAPGDATHVGLVLDTSGLMIDAPHAGAAVRIDAFEPVLGSRWGTDEVVGITRPGAA